jgi:hypothetical protein
MLHFSLSWDREYVCSVNLLAGPSIRIISDLAGDYGIGNIEFECTSLTQSYKDYRLKWTKCTSSKT